jgi:hypothetical protein
MGIIQTFTKQHPQATLGTALRTVQGVITNEAVTCCKEQVGVRTSQMRKCVKSYAVNGYEERGRKARLRTQPNAYCDNRT